jgi:ribosomal protein S18 acetylase RimI-like enzyme
MIEIKQLSHASAQDKKQLWSLVISSFPEDERPTYSQFMDMLDTTNVLVARDVYYNGPYIMTENIVGFVMLTKHQECPYIWIMAVHDDYRGIPSGAAFQLMNYVLASYKHKDIYLHCKVSNVIAQKFYRKHGFVDADIVKNHYPNEDGLLMRRKP